MDKMEKRYIVVDPEGLCPHYDERDTALPEEMDTCDLCKFYDDDTSCCTCPENNK